MEITEKLTTPEEMRDSFIKLMNEGDVTSSRNAKASVFTDLFEKPQYGFELLKVLHPETELTVDDIAIVTLKNVMANMPYNDLGILAGDRLMILVEAQSTYSVNILPRLLIYLAFSYKNYINSHEYDIYASKRVDLPKPEFYVIYTGSGNKPKEISFSKEFFDGEKVGVEITARVISDSADGDVIDQYIDFTHVLDENVKIHGRTREAIVETVQYCISHNILRGYLQEKSETEVVDLMMLLFDEETTMKNHDATIRREAREEGIFNTLVSLVKQGLLSITDAAKQAGETEEVFAKRL